MTTETRKRIALAAVIRTYRDMRQALNFSEKVHTMTV